MKTEIVKKEETSIENSDKITRIKENRSIANWLALLVLMIFLFGAFISIFVGLLFFI